MWHPVFMISGYVLGILGLLMLIPAAFDYSAGNTSSPFTSAALVTVFTGVSLFLACRTKIERITVKQGYLVTAACWVSVCIFSAVPFLLGGSTDDITDALFEATSGITGTGATIMKDVEALPRSVLMWRSLLNYVGGLGIVIFAVALLPFLGIGGMQMFRHENSDSNDKFMPKFSYIAKRIVIVYLLLTAISSVTLYFCGMDWFNSVNHAMSAIGTGGFSTKNNSAAAFGGSVELPLMIFMLAGALPMTFYILLLQRRSPDRNRQVHVFIKTVVILAMLLGAYLYFVSDFTLFNSLRQSFFTVISIVTTTGFSEGDYTAWGSWITAVILLLSLVGGCTGSTCGSVKIFRWQVVFAFLRKYFLSAVEPNRIIPLKTGEVNMPEKVTMSVFVYIFSFLICLVLLTVAVSACGTDLVTAVSAVTACITNVGLGAVNSIGPDGNYAFFSDEIKYLLCLAMLLGRLEIITLIVVFSGAFWKN